MTCGRLIDQRPDLLPSCQHLSTLVTIERPSTARGRPGRALVLSAALGVRFDRPVHPCCAGRPWPCQTAPRRCCPLSFMSAMDVTSHRLGSLATLACLRLALGFLALLDGVRRPLATVQVASRRTDHRQPPAPSALLRERSAPGLRTSHVSHPRSRPLCGPVQDCRAHVLIGRRTAPRSGARRAKEGCSGAHAFQLY